MPEEPHSSPPPSERPTGRFVDPASPDELDSLLAEAAALAADVSSELREDEPDSLNEAANVPLESLDRETTADVDARLEDLDALVGQAVREVGSRDESPSAQSSRTIPQVPAFMDEFTRPEQPTASAAMPANGTPDDKGSPAGVNHHAGRKPTQAPAVLPAHPAPPAVPSFMDEFTCPDESVATSAPAGLASSATPGPQSTAVIQPSRSDPKHSAPPQAQHPPAPAAVDESSTETDPDEPLDEPLSEHPGEGPPNSPLMATCWRAGSRLADLLEVLDRPLRGVGQRIRLAVGWLSVTLLVAAFVVFILTLL